MARPGQRGAVLLSNDGAQAAVLKALRHSLRCIDADCADCAQWRDVLDGGPQALLTAGAAVLDASSRGQRVEEAATAVVRAVVVARERPSYAARLDDVERALQALAAMMDEPLPPPRRKK